MTVKRFLGSNSRDAMQQVKAVLGGNALILANRAVAGGFEILAVSDEVAGGLSDNVNFDDIAINPRAAVQPTTAPVTAVSTRNIQSQPAGDIHVMGEKLLREMQDMRELLARHQTTPAGSPNPQHRLGEMLTLAGFGRELSAELLATLPRELSDNASSSGRMNDWLNRQILMCLPEPGSVEQLLEEGGVIAFVGPTGVGKTTTTAKLAAQYVMRHGPEKIALVSTDSYRVGAHEQLRIYANLLGVELYALEVGDDIANVLSQLTNKHLVLVDTVGLSQRDSRMAEQITALQAARQPVKLMLLLSAASEISAAEEVVTNYRSAARISPGCMIDCILTKLDEAVALGQVLDVSVRHSLRPVCVSAGQRVPEDIEDPDLEALISRALNIATSLTDNSSASNNGQIKPAAWPHNLLSRGRRLTAILNLLRSRVVGFVRLEKIWALSEQPESLQQTTLEALLEQPWPVQGRELAMLWQQPTGRGNFTHPIPDLLLDSGLGNSCAAFLQYRQPVDIIDKLAVFEQQYEVTRHLFTSLPDANTWQWLEERDHQWCVSIRPTQRVVYGGESLPVSQAASFASKGALHTGHYRGQEVQVQFSNLEVELDINRRRSEQKTLNAQCWFAEICDPDLGTALAQKYWLSPRTQELDGLLLAHLAAEALPALTRRVWEQLDEIPGFQQCRDLRLLVAASLAAVIAQVEQEAGDWGMDVRTQLQGLAGGNRYSSRNVVEIFLYLLTARELFQPGQVN
ncbi:MAG: flagellar biosynthesis protein FlhF [Gammaproteobacteria bacterium]|nr:MAG: flagellar biosynthesis protein FlhF [Gammaproteobacteria bacterium]